MGTRSRAGLIALAVAFAVLAPLGSARAGGFCSGYGGERLTTAKAGPVAMSDNCFSPTVLYVEPGDEVEFINKDAEVHAVGGTAGSFGDMHGGVAPSERVSYTFEKEGVYPYVCILHPGMAGAIVVGDGVSAAGLGSAVAGGGGDAGPATAREKAEAARAVSQTAPSNGTPVGVVVALAGLVVLAAILIRVSMARRGARVAQAKP